METETEATLKTCGTPGEISPGHRRAFVLGGNAIVTLQGKKKRYTFHIERNNKIDAQATHWVSVLRGLDNTNDFHFMGGITDRGFYISDKGRVRTDAPCATAFRWFWKYPESSNVIVLHAGLCGRCGRLLTTPESIRTGFGPVCARLK